MSVGALSQIAGVADQWRRRLYVMAIQSVANDIEKRTWCPHCQSTGWKSFGTGQSESFGGTIQGRAQCTCETGKRIAEAWGKHGFAPGQWLRTSNMKVLAFLQNMWVKDPERVNRMIDRDKTGELRSRLIAYALFAGCWTGHRLKICLGEQWCERIIWEEASPVITATASGCPPPDPAHIKSVLEKYQPDLVLCLSAPAEKVIRSLTSAPVVCGPHPAARGGAVGDELRRIKVLLEIFEEKLCPTHATPLTQPSQSVPIRPPNDVVQQP